MTEKKSEIGNIVVEFMKNVAEMNVATAAGLASFLHKNAYLLSYNQGMLVAIYTQIMIGEIEEQKAK